MNKITDYSSNVSKYELFFFLQHKIMSSEIGTFSELLDYCKNIDFTKTDSGVKILRNLFDLIRSLNWGFLKEITPEEYPKLWNAMVHIDKKYPFGGDLKRSMALTTIYIAMLDIHGYTKFCEENKNNLSKMHLLDNLMHTKISKIAKFYNVLSRRERGDEIVMIGTTASDTLSATVAIMGALSGEKILTETPVLDMKGLPVFKISAGLAGGNSNTPLIVTNSGDLSGYLLNNAARMQVRANILNPKENKIVLTKTMQFSFETENATKKCELYNKKIISFYDSGIIFFKGTDIPIVEAIIYEEEKYKVSYFEEMSDLMKSVKGKLWKQKLFLHLLSVISKSANSMPEFQIDENVNEYISSYNNTTIVELCKQSEDLYVYKELYGEAIMQLDNIIRLIKKVENFDKIVIEYAEGICEFYKNLLPEYDNLISKEIDINLKAIFPIDQISLFINTKKVAANYQKLTNYAKSHKALKRRKSIWYGVIEKELPNLTLNIYSGKK